MQKRLFQKSTLQVPDAILQATIAHLRDCLPSEGVALWSGPERAQVASWQPLPNTAANPSIHYAVSPPDWLHALHTAAKRGERPVALVHSHPTASAEPSGRDIANWHYPELHCVIVSFAAEPPEWAAYQI